MGAVYEGVTWDFYLGTRAKATLPLGVVLIIRRRAANPEREVAKEDGKLGRASSGRR